MFLPYKDDIPTDITPYVTIGLITTNALLFFLQIYFSEKTGVNVKYALVPKHFIAMTAEPSYPHPLLTLITSMFMHGGITHIVGNMLFLWIFGNNIEDTLGHFKFLMFYLLCGIMAAMLHISNNMDSAIPCLGASGAISGVLGAYILLYPYAKIRFIFIWFPFVFEKINMLALYYIAFWFVMQVFYSFIGVPGVGWFAHIGGFLAGAIIILISALFWPLKNNIENAKKTDREKTPKRPYQKQSKRNKFFVYQRWDKD